MVILYPFPFLLPTIYANVVCIGETVPLLKAGSIIPIIKPGCFPKGGSANVLLAEVLG